MIRKVLVRLNSRAVRDLLNSHAVRMDLYRRAKRIADAAGGAPGDFTVENDTTSTGARARSVVITNTPAAKRAEATGQALTRAIQAGRG